MTYTIRVITTKTLITPVNKTINYYYLPSVFSDENKYVNKPIHTYKYYNALLSTPFLLVRRATGDLIRTIKFER